jgi:hypothetical protein
MGTIEIVVHFSENLKNRQRKNMVAALEKEDGIVSAEFCPLHDHQMLVKYDIQMYSSLGLLASVRSQNVKARLMARNNW